MLFMCDSIFFLPFFPTNRPTEMRSEELEKMQKHTESGCNCLTVSDCGTCKSKLLPDPRLTLSPRLLVTPGIHGGGGLYSGAETSEGVWVWCGADLTVSMVVGLKWSLLLAAALLSHKLKKKKKNLWHKFCPTHRCVQTASFSFYFALSWAWLAMCVPAVPFLSTHIYPSSSLRPEPELKPKKTTYNPLISFLL